MEIKWSSTLLQELNEIVTYLKKNSMGELLENLGNYFIKKHMKYIQIENYSMNFTEDVIDPSIISDGEYKLAFICELIHIKKKKMINVYKCIAYMINFSTKKKFNSSHLKSNNKTFYIVSLLKDTLKIENTENLILGINLVQKIISNNKNVNLLSSLFLQSQNLDISILSPVCVRNIKEILKTERTLYVRFLLILSYDIFKNPLILKDISISFLDQYEFISKLSSPFYETIIYLTSEKIIQ